MNISLLSQIQPGGFTYILCVRISRIWQFRGKNDDDPVKHLDLVVIDQKGDSMYAEIPPDAISMLEPQLKEGKIVFMRKITVERTKPGYKVVQNPYMIRLNRRTEIAEVQNEPPDFPKYTFTLTAFPDLYQHTNKTDRFLDVIGQITSVSNAARVLTNQGKLQPKRIINLQDLNGNKIDLSLWGTRALEFNADSVYEIGQTNHIIAIFVGTSMKSYSGGSPFLSGTSACRWYINLEEITEIRAFYRSLPLTVQPVQKVHLNNDDDAGNHVEQKTLLQLKHLDPFEALGARYECSITFTRLTPDQTWCYTACRACNAKSIFNGTTYQCSKDKCTCTQIDYKYKISIFGGDHTCELEFMLFNEKATQLVGKPAQKLLTTHDKYHIPPEILSLIGHKITCIVRILPNKSIRSEDPTYEILIIKQKFGKQTYIPAFQQSTSLPFSAESYPINDNLPPLVPIVSKPIKDQLPSSSNILSPDDIQSMEIEQRGPLFQDSSTLPVKRDFESTINESNDDDDEELRLPDGPSKKIKKIGYQPKKPK